MMVDRDRGQRGTAMVELAVVLPLFLLLIFGIMEVGWLFAQQVEVRNGAREGARIAAVSAPDIVDPTYSPSSGGAFTYHDVTQRTCDALDLSTGTVSVTLTASGDAVGDTAAISLTSTYDSLTGFLDPFFGSLIIDTDVEFRLEQPRAWDPVANEPCP
jgi:Flp pilus assembly protein TadG